MQTYPVRTSHRKNLELATIAEIARRHFDRVDAGGGAVEAAYGAIEHLTVRPEGKSLAVDVRTNPKVEEAVARESIARYNRFLEDVTGYSAKERARKLRQSAGG